MVVHGFRQGCARDCKCCSQNMNNDYPSRKDFIEARKGLTSCSKGFKSRNIARKVLIEARKDFDSDVGHNRCVRTK